MADVSDPSIAQAYQDVRNDKTDTNWCGAQRFHTYRGVSMHTRAYARCQCVCVCACACVCVFTCRRACRLLISYETDTSNKLKVYATGSDGLDGFKDAVQNVTVRAHIHTQRKRRPCA
jgi:hypothetical protein